MSDEAVQDTTLPILDSISIKDPIVDRGAGDNNVTVVLAASDADSEVASIRVTVTDPDGGTMVKTLGAPSGELTFTISDDKPEGEYKVTEVVVTDTAGNARTYDGPDLSSLFNVAVTVKNAEEDTMPPELITFEVDDPIVDYSTGDRSFSVDITLTDDMAGVGYFIVALYAPDSTNSVLSRAVNYSDDLTLTLTLPENLAPGTYDFRVTAVDRVQNRISWDSDQLASSGFTNSITVVGSEADTTPPHPIFVDVLDPVVDVSTGDTEVTISFSFDDDISGVRVVSVAYSPPDSNHSHGMGTFNSTDQITFNLSENVLNGIYTLAVTVEDNAGNRHTYTADELQNMGLEYSFEVVGAEEDTAAPTLVDLKIEDPVVDMETGDREVTVYAHVDDDLSGIYYFEIRLISPTDQILARSFTRVYEATHTFVIPENFSNGEYTVKVTVVDEAWNRHVYTHEELVEMGFFASFEVIAPDATDTLPGSNDDDTLPGGNDDDTLPGGNDDDTLPGGNDDDTLPGGNDDDHDNGHGNDEDGVDDDNPGNSDGSNGGGNGGSDHDDNGHGNDEDGVDDSNPGNSSGTNRRLKGSDDDDTIEGSEGDDTITGGDGDDDLDAGDGDDQIWAGASDTGNDRLAGGRGNDVIGGGKGNDLIVGGNRRKGEDDSDDEGSDILYGGDGDDTLIGGGWDDSSGDGTFSLGEDASDEVAANSLWGGDGDDLIIGANGADTVGGGSGSDRVNAGGGNDKVYGGRGGEGGSNDVIDGGDGDDIVFASDGNDNVFGGDGDDDLYGGSGEDTVHGGDGDDTLWGGGGDDLFTGGSGADVFAFGATSGKDTVTDFSVAEDELRLTSTVTDFTDTASVAAAATEMTVAGQAGLLIDTGGGNSVFLIGLTVEDLSNMAILLD